MTNGPRRKMGCGSSVVRCVVTVKNSDHPDAGKEQSEEHRDMSGDVGKAVARAYRDAFNRGDLSAIANACNFPHIRLAQGKFTIIETREDFLQRGEGQKAALAAEGWHHSVMESLEVVHEGPDKVHLAIDVTRRRADGSVYNRFKTLWIVTLQEGHWGIQFRSSYSAQ